MEDISNFLHYKRFLQIYKTKLQNHSRFLLFTKWAKLLFITGSAQIIVQVAGLISGVLIIRLLPTQEYAFYTIANTMLGTMTLLTDSGISTGVMAQGGKVWQNRRKLGSVLTTGLKLRRKFAFFSVAISTPVLFYLLRKHDASWLMCSLVTLSLIPTFYTTLSGSLLEIVPKLQQNVGELQKIQALSNLGRLALSGLMVFTYPIAAVAIFSSGVMQIWANKHLQKISSSYIDKSQTDDPVVRAEIIKIVRQSLPNRLYFCISGQVSIFLLSFFGTTQSVAQLGALGRLSRVIVVFTSVLAVIAIPRFSRMNEDFRPLLNGAVKILAIVFLFSCLVLVAVAIAPEYILYILGSNYKGLTYEVWLITLSSLVGLFAGIVTNLALSRGWVINAFFNISINITGFIILINLIDLNNIQGVLLLNIFVGIIQLLIISMFFTLKLFKLK